MFSMELPEIHKIQDKVFAEIDSLKVDFQGVRKKMNASVFRDSEK